MAKFNRIALNKIVEQLESWVEATDEVRSNEEDKDYPNDCGCFTSGDRLR